MQNLRDAAETHSIDGTVKSVTFEDATVGYIGTKDTQTNFFWAQSVLHAKSTDYLGDAYSMSLPLIEKLETLGVDAVYVYDADTWVDFEKIKTGDLLRRTDSMFNTYPEHDQRVVYV